MGDFDDASALILCLKYNLTLKEVVCEGHSFLPSKI